MRSCDGAGSFAHSRAEGFRADACAAGSRPRLFDRVRDKCTICR